MVVFLDINIVLDIIDYNRINHNNAKKIWTVLVIKKYKILISEDMLSTIFYLNKNKKYTLEFFKIISERWDIVPFGEKVIKNAINLSLEKDLDLEDMLQCLCAKENGCNAFITNDKKFYDCGVSVYHANEFLERYS